MEQISQQELERRVREEAAHRKQLPGMSSMLSLDIESVDAGRKELVTAFTAAPWAENVNGTVHGGIITAAIDSTMGIFSRGMAYPRRGPTLNLNVNFLKPVRIGETMYTRVKLLRQGRNLMWMQAVSWTTDEEKLCASAEGTFYILDTK